MTDNYNAPVLSKPPTRSTLAAIAVFTAAIAAVSYHGDDAPAPAVNTAPAPAPASGEIYSC